MNGIYLLKVERPINVNADRIVLLPKEIFHKILGEKYIRILVSDSREGYSRSYYYFILDFLKENGLINDNSLSFTLALSVDVNEKGIFFGNELMFIDKSDKVLVVKTSSNFTCDNCPLLAECEFGLRKISQYYDVKLKGNNMCEKWNSIIFDITRNIVKKINKSALLSI